MITCNLMGGLGNQLFQIFTVIAHSIQSQNSFLFTDEKSLGIAGNTIRPTYWGTFFKELRPFLTSHFPSDMQQINEPSFCYNEIPVDMLQNKDILLFGYFQSYKYFQPHASAIYKMLKIKTQKKYAIEKAGFLKEQLQDTISMHFRIGDYKKVSHIHPIMTYEYYENCIVFFKQRFPEKVFNILYFCENQDIEEVEEKIQRLQTRFPSYKFTRALPILEDWEQLLTMSMCKYNIIANSTFSWWSAYLNTYKDKEVCYPNVWFGDICNHNTIDLFPDSWVRINAKY